MSNNRNRNRNRNRSTEPRVTEVSQVHQSRPRQNAPSDRVFVFNSRTGAQIRIPASAVFDPDADMAAEISAAQQTGDEFRAAAALLNFIKSGFEPEISDTIHLKLSELQEFTTKFFKFSGVSIPK